MGHVYFTTRVGSLGICVVCKGLEGGLPFGRSLGLARVMTSRPVSEISVDRYMTNSDMSSSLYAHVEWPYWRLLS